jgi:hemoglobin-like flavoprotein
MTLLHVMNRYHISIHHASLLVGVEEYVIVQQLLYTALAGYLEEVFLYEREKHLD